MRTRTAWDSAGMYVISYVTHFTPDEWERILAYCERHDVELDTFLKDAVISCVRGADYEIAGRPVWVKLMQ